ncbi:DUF1329 domain-containing protein [Pseudomonas sp. BF-R-24]|uniref:DUF1329 domain-containing protein n=1 Tax=Pseudomonas sp. BF-R-24 TaxID=2832386 RepID=UPI001CBBB283|nr:DUF1329 domain-containing protein [Pseudomonas sp. BF-R-24]
MPIKYSLLSAAVALSLAGHAFAAVSPQETQKLGTSLTPLGAEKSTNAAGTIPAWTGGLTSAPAGSNFKPGDHHPDPFPEDKVQFTIDKSNMEQYRANLTPGAIALMTAYPDTFKIPVYVTRRSGAVPQWVYENTRKNATTAELVDGGNGFKHAIGGVPFPIPGSGVEAIWNHIVRYRGTYTVRTGVEVAVQSNGSYVPIRAKTQALFKYYFPGATFESIANRIFFFLHQVKTPARLAGEALLVHETLDQVAEPRQAWIYSSGQRRVSRAPNVAFDSPIIEADGLRTADDSDMYNGSPSRYDWKLLGKKEMYIPYNNYRLTAKGVKYDDVLKPGHLNPELTRWELHRVWVVEANLKPGSRHIYSKRVFFLDEDSWQAAEVNQYDGRGELWRVSLAYLKNYYDLPATWSALDVYHDLQSRRYNVQNLDSEEETSLQFNLPVPEDSEFSPATLRRGGR